MSGSTYSRASIGHYLVIFLFAAGLGSAQVRPPDVSKENGTTITITCPDSGAVGVYALDGFDPNMASTVYVAPFTVAEGTMVRARCFLASSVQSLVAGNQSGGIPADAVQIQPGQHANSIVQNQPAGKAFVFMAGIHRHQAIEPKDNQRFYAQPGAILSGAKVVGNWQRSGSLWRSRGHSESPVIHGECRDDAPRCSHGVDLFLNNVPLKHVGSLSAVQSGTWYFDYPGNQIYIGSNPAGHQTEMSVSPIAFSGTGSGVVLQGLTIEKYASAAQLGAIFSEEGANWTIDATTVRLNHGGGAAVGPGAHVKNSFFVDNGQLGLTAQGPSILIEGNEIARNNFARFDEEWEAGGTKFVVTTDLVVRGNNVHHNDGHALWTDIDNVNTLYEDNYVHDNIGQGIKHEISYKAVIRNNRIENNTGGFTSGDVWLWGSQIFVQNSSNVEVYGNTILVGAQADGIGLLQQSRGSGSLGPYTLHSNNIHNNEVRYTTAAGASGLVAEFQAAAALAGNNRFHSNTYYAPTANGRYWIWVNEVTWSQLQAAGQEQNGAHVVQ